MELETINKLFLELSQFATATTEKEAEMIRWIIDTCILLRAIHNYNNQPLFPGFSDKEKLEYFASEAEDRLGYKPADII